MPVSTKDVHYLVFEGGGGKGAAYLGALAALEDFGLLPLTAHNVRNETGILGVAGSSAGAITAFLVSLGATSSDLVQDFLAHDGFTNYTSKRDLVAGYNPAVHFDKAAGALRYAREPVSANALPAIAKSLWLRNPLLIAVAAALGLGVEVIVSNGGAFPGLVVVDHLAHLMIRSLDQLQKREGTDVWGKIIEKADQALKLALEKERGGGRLDPIEDKKSFLKAVQSITFEQLYYATEIDLIIGGTNISQGIPVYFSAFHSPFMPVIPALRSSMSIPLMWRPVAMRLEEADPIFRDYAGLFADGGMLNNLPLHCFNTSYGKGYPEVLKPYEAYRVPLRSDVIGLTLTSESDRNRKSVIKSNERLSKELVDQLFDRSIDSVVGYVLESFLYPGGSAQSEMLPDRNQIIDIDTGVLSTYKMDSAPADIRATLDNAWRSVVKYFLGDEYAAIKKEHHLGPGFPTYYTVLNSPSLTKLHRILQR